MSTGTVRLIKDGKSVHSIRPQEPVWKCLKWVVTMWMLVIDTYCLSTALTARVCP